MKNNRPQTRVFFNSFDEYHDEGNNDGVALNPLTNEVNINDNSDDRKNDYEGTPDTPTNGGNNEMIDNDKENSYQEEDYKETGNENLNMKANDRESEGTEVNE